MNRFYECLRSKRRVLQLSADLALLKNYVYTCIYILVHHNTTRYLNLSRRFCSTRPVESVLYHIPRRNHTKKLERIYFAFRQDNTAAHRKDSLHNEII